MKTFYIGWRGTCYTVAVSAANRSEALTKFFTYQGVNPSGYAIVYRQKPDFAVTFDTI